MIIHENVFQSETNLEDGSEDFVKKTRNSLLFSYTLVFEKSKFCIQNL